MFKALDGNARIHIIEGTDNVKKYAGGKLAFREACVDLRGENGKAVCAEPGFPKAELRRRLHAIRLKPTD